MISKCRGTDIKYIQAIEQDAEAPLTVLDKRAATHIKLGDLDSALSDAGKIIRRDRSKAVVCVSRLTPSVVVFVDQIRDIYVWVKSYNCSASHKKR